MQTDEFNERRTVLVLGIAVEGGLVLLAFGIGWITGIAPLESFAWEWPAVVWGVAGALPVFALFLLSQRYPLGPLKQINRFLVEAVGPALAACRWYELVLIAAMAGFGEEVLFRGVLQPWIETWGWGIIAALVISNVIFGAAHLITPAYAVLAGVIGVYLGLMLDAPAERNLLTPVITHGLYDYLAFLVVVGTVRKEQAAAEEHEEPQASADLEHS
mgnify:CR=1 FL=1